jgi:hypothetical protein
MMEADDWEIHDDGSHPIVPIPCRNADEVRRWCAQNCSGDYLIILNPHVVFQCREDAALATFWWRREEG